MLTRESFARSAILTKARALLEICRADRNAARSSRKQRTFAVVHELITAGAPIDGQQIRYGTPLIAACVKGHAEMVKSLLEWGASPGPSEGKFGSAYEAAGEFGRIDIL